NGAWSGKRNWKKRNEKGNGRQNGQNENGRGDSNKAASTGCLRAPRLFSRPELSGNTWRPSARRRRTNRSAQKKNWNDGPRGLWRKRKGLIRWSGVNSCWRCETNRVERLASIYGHKAAGRFSVVVLKGDDDGKGGTAREEKLQTKVCRK